MNKATGYDSFVSIVVYVTILLLDADEQRPQPHRRGVGEASLKINDQRLWVFRIDLLAHSMASNQRNATPAMITVLYTRDR